MLKDEENVEDDAPIDKDNISVDKDREDMNKKLRRRKNSPHTQPLLIQWNGAPDLNMRQLKAEFMRMSDLIDQDPEKRYAGDTRRAIDLIKETLNNGR